MALAAILLCTTLVTNVGNTSVVTNDCREVPPPMVMTAPVENKTIAYMQPPSATVDDTVVERWTEKAKTEVQPASNVELQVIEPASDSPSAEMVAKPEVAKSVKPIRVKASKQSQNRKLRKAPRRASAIREANRIQSPNVKDSRNKKLNAWEKLQGILIGRPKT